MTVSPSAISARVYRKWLSFSTSFYCLFVTVVKLEISSLSSSADSTNMCDVSIGLPVQTCIDLKQLKSELRQRFCRVFPLPCACKGAAPLQMHLNPDGSGFNTP